MAKKEFPEIKEKNEGKFTAWVKKNMPGKSTCAAARNAIHDYETGHKSEANYEKKKELEVAAGESHGYFASASKVHKHGKGRS